MGFLSGIAGAIGGVASTILGNNSAKHEAQVNRDWQEDMSNTSVQRRVEDLKAAGLNPLLAVSSASSGASTPTGAQAQLKHFDPTVITNLMNGVASSKLIQSQAKAQEQENSLFETKAKAMRLQNDLMEKKIWTEQLEQGLKMAQTDAERAKLLTEAYRRANIYASTEKISNEAQLLGFQMNGFENTPLGRDMAFFSRNFSSVPRAVGGLIGLGLSSFNSAKSYADNKKYIPRQIDERRIDR